MIGHIDQPECGFLDQPPNEERDAENATQPTVNGNDNPKLLLNNFLMRYHGRPNVKGDILYDTVPSVNGFTSKLRLPSVAAKDNTEIVPEFLGEDCETEKQAEVSAASKALDHYADWIAANPAPPPSKKSKNKNKNKRKASELGEGEREVYDLKFVDGCRDETDAATVKSLNNQPAWMTRGVGVNKDLFGESKGNLVKPGMYEDDLARMEARHAEGNLFGDEPDPFGDVFAERKTPSASPDLVGDDVVEAPRPSWRSAGPLPPQNDHFSVRTPVAQPGVLPAAQPVGRLDPWSLV